MKKRVLMSGLLFIVFLPILQAQESLKEIPGISATEKFDIDPSTGLPEKFSELREKADIYRSREQNKSYLYKEWTVILSKNRFIGPLLFYTDKFFSFFNPLWEVILAMDFSWSWAFFVGLGLWIIIIIVVYFPAEAMFDNKLFGLITGIIVASITGFLGVINKAVLFFVPLIRNIWILIILIIFAVLLMYLYQRLFKGFEKESEEEKLERAKESIKTYGKVIEGGAGEI